SRRPARPVALAARGDRPILAPSALPPTDRPTEVVRKEPAKRRQARCRFCVKEGCPRPAFVDYKDVATLKRMCNSQGKMMPRKRTGNCAAFQRAVKEAVLRARFLALMPYVGD